MFEDLIEKKDEEEVLDIADLELVEECKEECGKDECEDDCVKCEDDCDGSAGC